MNDTLLKAENGCEFQKAKARSCEMPGWTILFDRRAKAGVERSVGALGNRQARDDVSAHFCQHVASRRYEPPRECKLAFLRQPGLHAQIEVHVDHASGQKVVAKRFTRPGLDS